ncbi:MAG: glycosyltransferase [Bacteroidota bacterium]
MMKVEMAREARVLICPLNWGLGHASRLIPVIRALDAQGFKVMIAAEGVALALLQKEFPAFYFFEFKGYKVKYSRFLPLTLKMLWLAPRIVAGIIREHYMIKKMTDDYLVDVVISDNRFGLWDKTVYSVYITHQVMIKMPAVFSWMQYPVHFVHKWFMKRYNEVWVPDFSDPPGLSGDLSHRFRLPGNAKYIGLLSRFSGNHIQDVDIERYDILVILSGPEPQRSILEKKLIRQIGETSYKTLLVRGLPKNGNLQLPPNIRAELHLSADKMKAAILSAGAIICRSGYSGIMDLLSLKRNAILIPTPGQTEQLYLARYYHEKNIFFSVSQRQFKLEEALEKVKACTPVLNYPTQNFEFLDFENHLQNEEKN